MDSASQFLTEEFGRRVRLNPRYSLRAFARSLGLSPGALSEVMRRRRPLSHKVAARVVKALGLNRSEANRLYSFIETERRQGVAPVPGIPDPAQKALDEDTFRLIAEWHHFAILNLMNCDGFRWHPAYVAKRLGLGIAQADLAMKLLTRLGLVVKRANHTYVAAHDFVVAPGGVPSAAMRSYHRQILEMALQALEQQSRQERDITGVGMALDPAHLPKIKREISDFQDQLCSKYAKGKKSEVYFLEVALFRLSQGDGNERE